jgi:hypothetical protein
LRIVEGCVFYLSTPAPVIITDPWKYRVQHSAWICGGGNYVSVHSATKSAKIWDLMALRGT